jgi:serine/threonine protein kinase
MITTKKISFRALGIMFYTLNAGTLPFNGDGIQLGGQIKNKPAPDLPIEFRQFSLFDDLLKR